MKEKVEKDIKEDINDDSKIEKHVFKNYRKILSGLLTAITIIAFFWQYLLLAYIGAFVIFASIFTSPTYFMTWSSVIITILIDIRALYLYINYALKLFSEKKRIRSILLLLILVFVVVLFKVQENIMTYKFTTLTYAILGITCMSIIPIVRFILDLVQIWKKYKTEKKNKRKSIIKTVALLIITVISQFIMILVSYSLISMSISHIKAYSLSEIFELKEKQV